jgi:flagellar biosynthesis protein FlhB
MSDTNDAASKTEEPTSRKLDQARERGDIVKTQDLPSLMAFAAATSALVVLGGWLSSNLAVGLMPFLEHPHSMQVQGAGGVAVARMALMAAAPLLAVVLGGAMLAGVGGHVIQTGLLWTPDRLKFDFKKVSPAAGFNKLFGVDALMQFVKSLLKVVAVGLIAWMVIRPHWSQILQLANMDPTGILPYTLDIFKRLAFAVGSFMLSIAGFDWFWQRQRFMVRQRMTKEEVKEDFKQTEGDPHVKGRQRQIRLQRARRRMMSAVPTATVVVMNPTHYAVALKYAEGEGGAPQCVAKGMDAIALKIRAVAEEAGVPVIEDPPLARALYAAIEIEDFIPVAHYEAVAKIIGFVLSGKGKRAGVS